MQCNNHVTLQRNNGMSNCCSQNETKAFVSLFKGHPIIIQSNIIDTCTTILHIGHTQKKSHHITTQQLSPIVTHACGSKLLRLIPEHTGRGCFWVEKKSEQNGSAKNGSLHAGGNWKSNQLSDRECREEAP
jgi:hypothetical protein